MSEEKIIYKRHKNSDELPKAALQHQFIMDIEAYLDGSDYIRFTGTTHGESFDVLFSTVNGRFFGNTKSGLKIDSDKIEYDDAPWFKSLLDFFYVRDES